MEQVRDRALDELKAKVDAAFEDQEGNAEEAMRVKGAVKVKAPVVISAAGAYNTLVRMMPLGAPKAVVENAEFAALPADFAV